MLFADDVGYDWGSKRG